jgi:hypothetical protein
MTVGFLSHFSASDEKDILMCVQNLLIFGPPRGGLLSVTLVAVTDHLVFVELKTEARDTILSLHSSQHVMIMAALLKALMIIYKRTLNPRY